jgi:hypothetical protein
VSRKADAVVPESGQLADLTGEPTQRTTHGRLSPRTPALTLRMRAISFLESLVLNFCHQLHSCPGISGCPDRPNGHRSGQSQDDEMDCQQFGLTMRTLDRKTGWAHAYLED